MNGEDIPEGRSKRKSNDRSNDENEKIIHSALLVIRGAVGSLSPTLR